MNIPSSVLDLADLTVEQVIVADSVLLINVRSNAASAVCPNCHQVSGHVHSSHVRSPRDLPVGEHVVRLVIHARRFACQNPDCPRRTFVERFPNLVPLYAQRTLRFTRTLEDLGFALGGRAGARLGRRVRIPASRDTILRTLRRADSAERPRTRVLGVDDFALLRGQSYGTILVDLEAHRPIDLLPDRTAATLAEWLAGRAGIEVITRDRSREYARGITTGAPTAKQVADRFHLLVNLREALERLLARLQGRMRKLPLDEQTAEALAVRNQATLRPLRGPSPSEQVARQGRRASRMARWEAVRALYAQGTPIRQIAKTLDLSWTTARNFAHAETYPERSPKSPQPSITDPYVEYLTKRWEAGCHNASQLWRELVEQGYPGARIQVARWARQRREARAVLSVPDCESRSGEAGADGELIAGSTPRATLGRLPGSRKLVWLLIRAEEKLDDEELTLRQHILQDPDVATAHELIQRFGRMVRERRPDQLDDWTRACQASGLAELRNFATYIAQDRAAVEAGLTERWSNGQTEGQITRLKLIKRQMYGQAGFDLLRRRVLQPA